MASRLIGASTNLGATFSIRRTAAIERRDLRKLDALQNINLRRPQPTLSDLEGRRRCDDLLAPLDIGLVGNPGFNRSAVLRRDKAHGDERMNLGQAVFMNFGRALADDGNAQPARAAKADQIVGGKQHICRLWVCNAALRHEQVSLVDKEIERPRVLDAQSFREIGEELRALATLHLRYIDDGRRCRCADGLCYRLTVQAADLNIRMRAAEDDDRIAAALASGAGFQAIPDRRSDR
jgi:hypothetical protein